MQSTRTRSIPFARVKQKFQVTIPSEVREKARLREGDLVEMVVHGATIILRPKVMVDRDEEAEAAIEEGLQDVREGRIFGPFASIKKFKAARKNV